LFLFRWKVDLTKYPFITSIEKRLNETDAFKAAHPNQQPDYPKEEKS
jgi:hypothetical protein